MGYGHASRIVETKPSPLLGDVKPGEIWVLTIGAWEPFAAVVREVRGEPLMFPEPSRSFFQIIDPAKPQTHLKSAHRIWPVSTATPESTK